MSQQRSLKIKKLQYFGICKYTQVDNKADIVIKDHRRKTCKFIDLAVPSDRNTSLKTTEKLSKHKDRETATIRMWEMNTETIPIVIGPLGLQKHVPGAININELQKNNFIRNSPHTKKAFVSKPKFIGPVVP